MAAGRADLPIYQGDTWAAVVLVVDSQDPPQPVNITGYTALAQIRRAVADADPVVVATIATTVASPNVYLALTNAQTAVLSGRYVWDLQITSPANAVTTILAGNVIVTAEVSRAASA